MARKSTSLINLRGYVPGALASGGRAAGEILSVLGAVSSGRDPIDDNGNPVDSETISEIKRAVKKDPGTALTILSSDTTTGLSCFGRAQVLDAVIGLVGDDEASAEMVREKFTISALVEIVRAQGDLPSAIAMIVEAEIVFDAMLSDAFDSEDKEHFSHFVLLSWAAKLKDREDWGDMLEQEVEGTKRTLREVIISAIMFVHNPFDNVADDEDRHDGEHAEGEDMTLSAEVVGMFGRYGIEVDSFEEISEYRIEVDDDELEEARRCYTQRRAALRSAPLREAEDAASATQDVADDLDL